MILADGFWCRSALDGVLGGSEEEGMDVSRLVTLARGLLPADLLLTNGRLVNVFSGEVYPSDIAVAEGVIVGLGEGYRARDTVDLGGRFVCPGFIDAHVHVESSLVTPREFAGAVVPRGVTAAIANPHEIANVLGVKGIRFMVDGSAADPLTLFATAPSCVPASDLATSGARLGKEEVEQLLDDPRVLGLGEVMDFPAVLSGGERVLSELRAATGRPVDGHAPGLRGRDLNGYVASGITSDHECTTIDEARERLRLGMAVFAREGSVARDLRTILPLVTPTTERRICLCTDDRDPKDLLEEGSVDHLVRLAIREGVDPVTAIRMATLNPAEHYGLKDRGAVAIGRAADLVVFSELAEPRADSVFRSGSLVARGGSLLSPSHRGGDGGRYREARNTVRVDCSGIDLEVRAAGGRIRVIEVVPDQIVTGHGTERPAVEQGRVRADPSRDLLKMAVIERHRGSGRLGIGFVRGMGLRRGAIASTVAHDHHNLVVVGADDGSMRTAVRAVAEGGGGLAAAEGDRVLALLELPIAGLMSDQPICQVARRLTSLLHAARQLGSPLRDPFMTLSFLALEVVPSLKLTDLGLVDVDAFRVVPLFVS